MSRPASQFPRAHPRYLLPFFVAGSLLLFLPAFNNAFRRDDFAFLEQMVEFGNSWRVFAPVDRFAFFRPGAIALFRAEYALFGMHSAPYLVANYLLHIAVALCGIRLLRTLGAREAEATLAAGLFLVGVGHYGKTVIWAASGGTIVAALLCVVAVNAALHARDRVGARVALVAASVVAPSFHEVGLLAGVLAVLCSLVDARASKRWTLAAAAISLAIWCGVWTMASARYTPYTAIAEGAVRVPFRFAGYLSLLVLPLATAQQASGSLSHLLAMVAPLRIPVGLLTAAALVWTGVRDREVRFVVLWVIAAVLPFTLVTAAGDALQLRYTYLAALPFCAVVARVVGRLPARVAVALGLGLALYAASIHTVIERHYDRAAGSALNRELASELQQLRNRVGRGTDAPR